jgi:hypothetical protein
MQRFPDNIGNISIFFILKIIYIFVNLYSNAIKI